MNARLVAAGVLAAALLPLAGCVDTSFDVCASNATAKDLTVNVWLNSSKRSFLFSGVVLPSHSTVIGHMRATEGSYSIDAVAGPGNTSAYAYHGPSKSLGSATQTLHVDIASDGISVLQGESQLQSTRICGHADSSPPPSS